MLPPASSYAAENVLQAENAFIFQDDLVAQGVTNRQDYYFEIPEYRTVSEGSYIELFFSHSPTLLPDRSTMTVLLDDIPLGSRFLDGTNRENGSWKIDIGEMDLAPGFHKLSILLRMEATDNICVDQNNPANWVRLNKESVIHLRFADAYGEADLSMYPAPFAVKGSQDPFQTIFVMPDEPTESEWIGLAKLSRFFSGLNVGTLNIDVVKEGEIAGKRTLLADKHLIWIGSPSSWNGAGKAVWDELDDEAALPQLEKGYVRLRTSDGSDKRQMLLVTGKDEGLLQAVRMLTEETLYRQLAGHRASVSSDSASSGSLATDERSSHNNRKIVTLASQNYNDLVVEGLLVGSARITYAVPPEWDISRGGKLRIHFSHSKALNFRQSLAMIRINGIPAASAYLSAETSEFGVLEADIPEAALASDYIVADVSFQFSSAGDACSGNAQIGNWAVIHKDSYFSFHSVPNRDLQLSNLPYPLVSGSDWNDFTVLVPAEPTSADMRLFALVHSLYGGSLESYDRIELVKSRPDLAVRPEWEERSILAIGSAAAMPEWLMKSDNVPVSAEDGRWIVQNDRVRLVADNLTGSSVIQVFPSPLDEARDAVMFTALMEKDTDRLGDMLVQREQREKLNGQVAVLDRLNRVHVFDTDQYAPVKSLWDQWASLAAIDKMPMIQRILFIFAVIAALGVFAVIVWLLRRRKPEENEEQDDEDNDSETSK